MKLSFSIFFALSLSLLLSLLNENSLAQEKLSLKISSPSGGKSPIELAGSGLTVMGSLSPADSKLSINGAEALVDIDGTFICFTRLNLESQSPVSGETNGKLTFLLSHNGSTKTIEKVYKVKLPIVTSTSDSLVIDKQWPMEPLENTFLSKGEALDILFKATPGCKCFLYVEGLKDSIPLSETVFVNSNYWGEEVFGAGASNIGDTIKGIYKCSFYPNLPLKSASLKVKLIDSALGSKEFELPGRVTTLDKVVHSIARLKYDPNLTVGRNSPGGGYKIFLPEGVNLEVIGQKGGWLKTKLSSNESVYIPSSSAEILPEGTPLPQSHPRIIRCKEGEKSASVEIALGIKLPFIVNQLDNPERIELLIYNVTSDIDWVFYDRKSEFIKEIRHSQLSNDVLKVEIQLEQKTHWGYKAEYDGNILKLSIKKPAKRNSGFLFWSIQLKGRVISIDPGHTPETGAIGPRGTEEKDVNFEISEKLKQMLEDSGAKVFLTHEKDQALPLRERKQMVNSFDPEISVSMHNNAVPGGVNPIEHNGTSVYYYFPQALPLAKLIHKNLLDELKLKDFGLFWDNLYMCRIPESISLLIEPAFMIIPEQERLLRTDEFQRKIAQCVYNALEKFYEEYSQ
ncbi:MAG: N-acetylmuramoyl-L-alanine amidase [Bacteroidota bacterium]|nr:N-acetylmuramoyl-L-alanine amidase [Bacteroidota bacterium]